MGATQTDRVVGLRDLQRKLHQLNSQMQTKVARRVVASGAAVVKKEARRIVKANGSVQTGALHKNVVLKRVRKSKAGVVQYNVGVRHGRALRKRSGKGEYLERSKKTGRIVTKYENDPYYWRFIEFGHKTVPRRQGRHKRQSITKRRKRPTGFVPAKPFLSPALANKRYEAADKMRDVLRKAIIKQGGYQHGR